MIKTISDNLPRLSIYEKLNHDPALQTALLNIYSDVVEFSVRIFQYLKHPTIGKFSIYMVSIIDNPDEPEK